MKLTGILKDFKKYSGGTDYHIGIASSKMSPKVENLEVSGSADEIREYIDRNTFTSVSTPQKQVTTLSSL